MAARISFRREVSFLVLIATFYVFYNYYFVFRPTVKEDSPRCPTATLPTCSYSGAIPNLSAEPKASFGGSALVTMSAYFLFLNSNQRGAVPFQPKEVHSFDHNHKITLKGDCFDVTLLLRNDTDYIEVNQFMVTRFRNDDLWKGCRLRQSNPIKFKKSERYECQQPAVFECVIEGPETVGFLFVNELLLELDGDARRARDGIYSKPARYCA